QLSKKRHRLPRECQLPPDSQCQRTSHHQHQQGGQQELQSDHLMIGGESVHLLQQRELAWIMMMLMTVLVLRSRSRCRSDSTHRSFNSVMMQYGGSRDRSAASQIATYCSADA